MADKSKLGGFVWKSQLLGISACKLWAWGWPEREWIGSCGLMGSPGEEGNQTRHGPVSLSLLPHRSAQKTVEGMRDKQTFTETKKHAICLKNGFSS